MSGGCGAGGVGTVTSLGGAGVGLRRGAGGHVVGGTGGRKQPWEGGEDGDGDGHGDEGLDEVDEQQRAIGGQGGTESHLGESHQAQHAAQVDDEQVDDGDEVQVDRQHGLARTTGQHLGGHGTGDESAEDESPDVSASGSEEDAGSTGLTGEDGQAESPDDEVQRIGTAATHTAQHEWSEHDGNHLDRERHGSDREQRRDDGKDGDEGCENRDESQIRCLEAAGCCHDQSPRKRCDDARPIRLSSRSDVPVSTATRRTQYHSFILNTVQDGPPSSDTSSCAATSAV